MKTKFALAFYHVAIAALVVTAGGIVWKLIIFPPCTPTGNTCVVDPSTVTGLASSVLGVAATVLAILGAVAVAAWWTSLNDRVTEHVNKLYETHKAEIGKQLADFLADQQREMSGKLSTVQTSLQTVEGRIGTANADIDHLEQRTRDVEEIAVDGFIMMWPVHELEGWAERAIANHRFPMVSIKMSERYLAELERGLPKTEDELMSHKDDLSEYFQRYKHLAALDASAVDPYEIESIHDTCEVWLKEHTRSKTLPARALIYWDAALRWRTKAADEKVDTDAKSPGVTFTKKPYPWAMSLWSSVSSVLYVASLNLPCLWY